MFVALTWGLPIGYHEETPGRITMAKSIKGSKTEQNLLKAFAGESQARNRYTYFASAARKENLQQIANIFQETADNEREHAKVYFSHLEGGDLEITAMYPAGAIKDTRANLEAAADGEKMEWTTLYPEFGKIAREEGFPEVARSFEQIAKAERFHEARYRKLVENVSNGEVFKRKSVVKWHCINCGYVFEGAEPPKECPACRHPQSFYEVLAENY
jgi:rubrerythrin